MRSCVDWWSVVDGCVEYMDLDLEGSEKTTNLGQKSLSPFPPSMVRQFTLISGVAES